MSLQKQPTERKIIRHGGPFNKEQIIFPKKGRTKQSFTDDCDINKIVARYQKTGAIAHLNKHQADYGFATSDDFSTAMRTVIVAQEMFDGLPSSIRNRFANDPGQFLDFVQDADNIDEGRRLGLWPDEEPGATEAAPEPKKADPEPEPPKKTDPDPEKE